VAAIREILDGGSGPRTSIVAANAGAALYVAGNARSLAEGARLALDSIRSGRARDVLARLVEFTRAENDARGLADPKDARR
jgi:anthranilate phosphoribosyltransferase